MENVPASAGKTARIIEWRTTSMFSNLLNVVHILYYNANFTAQLPLHYLYVQSNSTYMNFAYRNPRMFNKCDHLQKNQAQRGPCQELFFALTHSTASVY